jgi:hypothetical protein
MRIALLVVVVLCAGCSLASGGSSSSTAPQSRVVPLLRYRGDGVTFTYPAEWRYRRRGWVGSIAQNFVDLGTQRIGPVCIRNGNETRCGLPAGRLHPNGVVVEWIADDLFVDPKHRPRPVVKIRRAAPRVCRPVGTNVGMTAQVVTARGRSFLVVACLRGPDDHANAVRVRAMLDSARTSR